MSAPRSGTRRIIVIGALVIAALVGLLVLRDRMLTPEPVRMMTAPVARGTIEKTVLATGTLKPAKLVAVGAQVSGRITAVKVRLGDRVRQGDPVAEIDSVPQQNALRTAEAALAAAKAQKQEKEASLVLAEQTLARQKKLVLQTAVSQADFESAQAEVATTRAQIAALAAQIAEAEVAVDTARVNLGYTRITAPMDGTVLYIVSQEGQTVNAAQTAPTIIILGDLETMMVRAEISEADVVNVKAGQKLYFNIIGDPDRRYEATLEFIEPAPESITGDSAVSTTSSSTSKSSSSSSTSSSAIYYNGIFYVPNPEGRLRTYMTAEVHIILGQARDVLTIPSAALGARARDGSYTVRVLGADGQVADRAVEIGLNNKNRAEVKSGLKEGEKVVTGQLGPGAAAPSAARRMPPPPMGL
ncbi:efflux RND transporter periplasmic adaptor subunit [Xanthobacter sediminis]|uniref:efflux RND transporter periplasmic adaptor subunit n=1 Tax=Xanthobacter sediminis TaxID=3119926 RepID=UPI0037275FC8